MYAHFRSPQEKCFAISESGNICANKDETSVHELKELWEFTTLRVHNTSDVRQSLRLTNEVSGAVEGFGCVGVGAAVLPCPSFAFDDQRRNLKWCNHQLPSFAPVTACVSILFRGSEWQARPCSKCRKSSGRYYTCTVFICAALQPRYVFRMFEPALVEYALPGGHSSWSLKCVNNPIHKTERKRGITCTCGRKGPLFGANKIH